MTADPTQLSDEALAVALAVAHATRLADGRLGIRTELALLMAEQERRIEVRHLQRAWEMSS